MLESQKTKHLHVSSKTSGSDFQNLVRNSSKVNIKSDKLSINDDRSQRPNSRGHSRSKEDKSPEAKASGDITTTNLSTKAKDISHTHNVSGRDHQVSPKLEARIMTRSNELN